MKKRNISTVSLSILFPSIITMLSLCLGITAVRYAIDAKYEISAILIIVASVMDALDGKIARLLNSTTNFGAQLDSLADLISFGVAPSIVIYLWSLQNISYKGVGWAFVLLYIISSAFRLARFNVQTTDKKETFKHQYFFTGLPIPAAGFLLLLPLILTFRIMDSNPYHWFMALYMLLVSILMVSKVPIFSGKKIKINKNYVLPLLISVGVIISGILIEPWVILPIIGAIYILSIPIGIIYYYKYFNNLVDTSHKKSA